MPRIWNVLGSIVPQRSSKVNPNSAIRMASIRVAALLSDRFPKVVRPPQNLSLLVDQTVYLEEAARECGNGHLANRYRRVRRSLERHIPAEGAAR